MNRPKVVHYRSDGNGRDSYINVDIRRPTRITNIASRRDTLPDNVYRYLKDQVQREEYQDYVKDLSTLGSKVEVFESSRRVLPKTKIAMQDEAHLATIEEKYIRQKRLKALYEMEYQQWQRELHAMGLAIERPRE
eukprot:Sspe_Gene.6216::Locus_2095_Transcript_1_8_Confidence_0.182_Length_491::g.6216::m.6216